MMQNIHSRTARAICAQERPDHPSACWLWDSEISVVLQRVSLTSSGDKRTKTHDLSNPSDKFHLINIRIHKLECCAPWPP
ncbi:hypothetical protein AG1IA_10336 [Rhizoctonia solani AG-1 IA]|uniref:Uncharacterized protein n=1 Tax=Thanatephorus cucumeris (strain AG1-IA) TaxID=983506 RepID=L8WGW7_THACA|nr:hypothetical protein AG1IA_10336 [Rhizoctonia solani AG-1 IA]